MIARLLPSLTALLFFFNAAQAWIAEWIYPLDQSYLWNPPRYQGPLEEIQRIQIARRFVPKDPRYAHKLTRLYFRALSEGLLDPARKERAVAEVVKDFGKGVRERPLYTHYLAGLALFLQSAVEGENLSEEKVRQALFLGSHDYSLREFVATYYQERGMHQRSLELWRSILEEDPSQTGPILESCLNYYQSPSFLLDLAPREKIESLIRFQNSLISFQPKDTLKQKLWGEKAYLKTLPLLIEKAGPTDENIPLLEVIAKSYQAAWQYPQAYFWFQRAFRLAKTPDSQASFLLASVDALSRQGRYTEAHSLLKEHLDLSSVKAEILLRYADLSWRIGKRKEAIEILKREIRQKPMPPDWRDLLAFFLYEESRFQEAAGEWRTLLRETQGTAYEKDNRSRILHEIEKCQQALNRLLGL